MTERELRRTALVILPRGGPYFAAGPPCPGCWRHPLYSGRVCPPDAFFCLLWAGLVLLARLRGLSFAAALGAETLTVYAGIAFPVKRAVSRRAVTEVLQLRTRCCGWPGPVS